MIAALLFALGTAQASSPPIIVAASPASPPMVSNVSPAPPIVVTSSRPSSATALPAENPITLELHVTGGGHQLWYGALQVSRSSGASYSESTSEAAEIICPNTPTYGQSERKSLNINIYWQETGYQGPAANVSVNWQRPSPGLDCTPPGTRSVQISQMVRLVPGQSETIQGDGGLVVKVTRR